MQHLSWTILYVAKIPIRVHISLLLIMPFFTWVFGQNITIFLEQPAEALLLNPYLLGFLVGVGLFVSVALHELAHSLVALGKGIKINNITLMLIGGVAQLEDFSGQPKDEAAIAAAGPLLSAALGATLLFIANILPSDPGDFRVLSLYLGQINVVLAVFNLIPAFPSDGGRVLRALLAHGRDWMRATKIAVFIGQGFAVFFAIFGLLSGNIMLLLVAFFIYAAAGQEYNAGMLKTTLAGFKVRDLMSSKPVTVSDDASVNQLLEKMQQERHTGYPVTASDGTVVGCVTMEDVAKVVKEERDQAVVREIMSCKLLRVAPDDDIVEALKKMTAANVGRLFVFEEEDLIGIITRSDILKGYRLRQL